MDGGIMKESIKYKYDGTQSSEFLKNVLQFNHDKDVICEKLGYLSDKSVKVNTIDLFDKKKKQQSYGVKLSDYKLDDYYSHTDTCIMLEKCDRSDLLKRSLILDHKNIMRTSDDEWDSSTLSHYLSSSNINDKDFLIVDMGFMKDSRDKMLVEFNTDFKDRIKLEKHLSEFVDSNYKSFIITLSSKLKQITKYVKIDIENLILDLHKTKTGQYRCNLIFPTDKCKVDDSLTLTSLIWFNSKEYSDLKVETIKLIGKNKKLSQEKIDQSLKPRYEIFGTDISDLLTYKSEPIVTEPTYYERYEKYMSGSDEIDIDLNKIYKRLNIKFKSKLNKKYDKFKSVVSKDYGDRVSYETYFSPPCKTSDQYSYMSKSYLVDGSSLKTNEDKIKLVKETFKKDKKQTLENINQIKSDLQEKLVQDIKDYKQSVTDTLETFNVLKEEITKTRVDFDKEVSVKDDSFILEMDELRKGNVKTDLYEWSWDQLDTFLDTLRKYDFQVLRRLKKSDDYVLGLIFEETRIYDKTKSRNYWVKTLEWNGHRRKTVNMRKIITHYLTIWFQNENNLKTFLRDGDTQFGNFFIDQIKGILTNYLTNLKFKEFVTEEQLEEYSKTLVISSLIPVPNVNTSYMNNVDPSDNVSTQLMLNMI